MSAFSYWKQHNLSPWSASRTGDVSSDTPHTINGDLHGLPEDITGGSSGGGTGTRSATVPRVLFATATPDASVLPASSLRSRGSRPVSTSAGPVLLRGESCPTTTTTTTAAAHAAAPASSSRASSQHRPASAATPGMRAYFNHLQPIRPQARKWMDEYRTSAPTSRATSAQPAAMSGAAYAPHGIPPLAPSENNHLTHGSSLLSRAPAAGTPVVKNGLPLRLSPLAAVAPGTAAAAAAEAEAASASPSILSRSASQHTPGHWTDTRKPRPPSPIPGQRRTSKSLFTAVPVQPEERPPAEGSASFGSVGTRRRSAEASLTATEEVRVLLERLPNVVSTEGRRGQGHATVAAPAVGRPEGTWLAVACPGNAVLTASEWVLTDSAAMPTTTTTTATTTTIAARPPPPPPATTAMPVHGAVTAPSTGDAHADNEFLEASLRAQTSTFREGVDGRPITAHPLHARHTRCGVSTGTTTTSPPSAIIDAEEARSRGGVESETRDGVEASGGPALPCSLGDYDWIHVAAAANPADVGDAHPNDDEEEEEEEGEEVFCAPGAATGAAAGANALDDMGDESDASATIPVVVPAVPRMSAARLSSAQFARLVVSSPHRGGDAHPAPQNTRRPGATARGARDATRDDRRFCPVSVEDDDTAIQRHQPQQPHQPQQEHPPVQIEGDVSPLPRVPDLTDSSYLSQTDTDVSEQNGGLAIPHASTTSTATPPAVREPFVDLLPGLQSRASGSRHSLDSQKGRLMHAVPAMMAVTTSDALTNTAACESPLSQHQPQQQTLPSSSSSTPAVPAFTPTVAVTLVRTVSGVEYPSSSVSTPGYPHQQPARPMNPRLSEQPFVPTPGPPSSITASAPLGAARAGAGATAAAVVPQKPQEAIPDHLLSQLRQAIRDSSLMRSEHPGWDDSVDGAPLSVTSTHSSTHP